MGNLTAPGGLPVASFAPQNPAGRTAESLDEQMKALTAATESLAQRYDNPNWFNVAAGFLKPQLGGFAASLGSASQAMGENVERQRENMLPVAAMRAELGRLKATQEQKGKADVIAEEHQRGDNPNAAFSGVQLGQMQRLDPNGPAYKGAMAQNAELTRLQQQKQTAASTAKTVAEAASTYSDKLFNPMDPAAGPSDVAAHKAELIKAASGIPGANPENLAQLSIDQLKDTLYKNQKNNYEKSFEDKTLANQVVKSVEENTNDLAVARTLVDKPKVAELLGTTKGNDVLSTMMEYIKSGTPDKGAKFNNAVAQLKASDPDTFDDFQVLSKVMMRNVAATRATMSNPSISATDIAALSNPTGNNTAKAIRKIYDLMAHEEYSKGMEAKFAIGYKGEPGTMTQDPKFEALKHRLSTQRRGVAKDSALTGVPDYYSLYSHVGSGEPAAASAAASAAAPATKSTSPNAAPKKRWSTQDYIDQSKP